MNNKPIVHICAWCPDKEQRDAEVDKEIYDISHALCPECAKKVMEEIDRVKISVNNILTD